MKIRLGYACISKTLNDVTSSHTYTYTQFLKDNDFQKLDDVIIKNFNDLEKIINYNIKNNIHFYRLSPKLIPLATHREVNFDYIDKYKDYYRKIANLINKHNIRVDIHLDEYCVINSTNKEVIENSYRILEYCYNLLDEFKIKDKVLILHIGSSTFGKEQGLRRFINSYNKLPKKIRQSIAIENDDKVYTVEDCLFLNQKLGVKIVLDYHHYLCNHNEKLTIVMLQNIFSSWNDLIPKVHFSSPKNNTKKDFRTHHEYINEDDFISFINFLKDLNKDVDIMLEAKGKDEALFGLVRLLKCKSNYFFLDESTFVL